MFHLVALKLPFKVTRDLSSSWQEDYVISFQCRHSTSKVSYVVDSRVFCIASSHDVDIYRSAAGICKQSWFRDTI